MELGAIHEGFSTFNRRTQRIVVLHSKDSQLRTTPAARSKLSGLSLPLLSGMVNVDDSCGEVLEIVLQFRTEHLRKETSLRKFTKQR